MRWTHTAPTRDIPSPQEESMELYYSPLACSLASRIALYEAGADVTFVEVDPTNKRTARGDDYLQIHPLGLVPALSTDGGELLTESAAILQFIAARHPEAGLAPSEEWATRRLQQWLSFIGAELHKAVFVPLLDKSAPEAVKRYALDKAVAPLALLERHFAANAFLLDRFSVADAYLTAILNRTVATPVDLTQYPNLRDYHRRMRERPSVARATAEEFARYQQTR
jgi:glutathione S-transferase